MRVDGVFVAVVSIAPHAVQQFQATENTTRVRRKVQQQVELPGGQIDGLAAYGRAARRGIDLQAANPDLVLASLCGTLPQFSTAQDRFDARDQFENAEWLGDVVVGTDLEAHHAIQFRRLRRQHQYGYSTRVLAKTTTDFQPVDTGQPEIENDQVP